MAVQGLGGSASVDVIAQLHRLPRHFAGDRSRRPASVWRNRSPIRMPIRMLGHSVEGHQVAVSMAPHRSSEGCRDPSRMFVWRHGMS